VEHHPNSRPTLTSLLPFEVRFDVGFLEWPPFEVLLVSTALNLALRTLLATGLLLAALQSFVFACYTACKNAPSVRVQLACFCIYHEALLKRPQKGSERYTIATLGLLRLGRSIGTGTGTGTGTGSSRLLARRSLLGLRCRRALFASTFSHGRLIVSCSRRARAVSQEDGRRGDMDVLGHQSVPSARGGVAQSHGGCQCMAGIPSSFGVRNEMGRYQAWCTPTRRTKVQASSRHRLPYRLNMLRITLSRATTIILPLSASYHAPWVEMAPGTADKWSRWSVDEPCMLI
jgi:hypothetical protein